MRSITWEQYNPIPEDEDDDADFGRTMKFVLPAEAAQKRFLEGFNFWLGHCNFKITKDFFNQLDDMDGVEALNYITPYRFVIAIGKSFDPAEVKSNIDKLVSGGPDLPDEIIENLDHILNETHGQKCIICILPNGWIEYSCIDDEDFQEKIELFKEIESEVGGLVIYNE